MFTEQVGQLDSAKTVDDLKDILKWLLGNCEAALTHRGPVTIDGFRPEGATDAMLTVKNGYIAPDDALTMPDSNNELSNGWALEVFGGIRFNGPFVGGFGWAKATGNWTNVAGDLSYVDATLATDRTGTLDSQARTIRIYLPRYGTGFDPAVYTDGVIKYELDPNGVPIGKDYPLNTRIGERKCVDSTSNIPTGWQLADGTNGTLDMRDAYIGGYKSGGTFGTVDGAYGNSGPTITISGNGGTINTSSTTTGITLPDHNHTATMTSGTPEDADSGAGYSMVYWTATPTITVNNASITPTDPGHLHTVNTDTMAATLSVATAGLPHTVAPVWIERVS